MSCFIQVWNISESSPNIITQGDAKHPASLIAPLQRYLLDSTTFRRTKRESKRSVRIFETTRTTNNEENMNAP
jgi:hypothetical protein